MLANGDLRRWSEKPPYVPAGWSYDLRDFTAGILRREGKEHTLWENPQTGHAEAVPRHSEIANLLARKICRRLSIPDPPG